MKKTWKLLLILFIVLILSIIIYSACTNHGLREAHLELIGTAEYTPTYLYGEKTGISYDIEQSEMIIPGYPSEVDSPEVDFENYNKVISRGRRILRIQYDQDSPYEFSPLPNDPMTITYYPAKIIFDDSLEEGKIFFYQMEKLLIMDDVHPNENEETINQHYVQVGFIRRPANSIYENDISTLILQAKIIHVVILLGVVVLLIIIIKKRKKKHLPFKKSE